MTKDTKDGNRPREPIAVPFGLKPFPFIAKRKPPKTYSNTDDSQDDLGFPAEWDFVATPTGVDVASGDNRTHALQQLIDRLESGGDVTARAIRNAIGRDAWNSLKAEIEALKPMPMPARIAMELAEYDSLLKVADSLYRRAEYARSPRPAKSRGVGLNPKKSLHTRAEGAYENAVEFLHEVAYLCPAIINWLDRAVIPGQIDEISTEPESVPRLITSKSQHAHTLQQKKRFLVISRLRHLLTGENA